MMFAVAFAIVLLSVVILGGDLRRLGDVQLRWVPVLLIGLLTQIVVISLLPEGSQGLRQAAHLGSYLVVFAFMVANLRVPGIPIVLIGALMNFVAIAANGGVMPARPEAVRAAGWKQQADDEFMNSRVVKHPRLGFLGDVFAIPKSWPVSNVFSVGDVVILLGAGYGIHLVCASRVAKRNIRVGRNGGASGP
jgi:hypothetical protein